MINNAPMVRLGELIEIVVRPNVDNKYGINDVRGVSNTKQIQSTKANMDGRNFSPFTIIAPSEFVFNRRTTRNGERLGLGFNQSDRHYIFTEDYVPFRVKDENVLHPAYLYILFLRDEFDRYVRWDSWGSATEFFNWENMCDVIIPLPSIETQRALVAIYDGLQKTIAENEALIKEMESVCHAFVVDCKTKYPKVKLGEWIEEYDVRNSDNKNKKVRSVSVTKEFKETNAKVNKNELSGYKLVPPGYIAYVQTTKNEKCFANAYNASNETCVVTSVDRVITTRDNEILDVGYLHLFLREKEFDRYAIFNSWGSAREVFSYDELCNVLIPLPPIEMQRSIVNIFNCQQESKRIVQETRELMKNLCPALVQKAAHSA